MSTNPRRQSTKAPKVALLHRHDNGTIHALSSDGRTVYTVRLGEPFSCTCPGFTHHGHCYHTATAVQRFAAFWPRPAALIVPAMRPTAPADDPEPEPPTPAASAARRACVCDLYDVPACPRCHPAKEAA